MILRSVMRHVREQNWIAVGLDFLIVVVGVFIGIQVANWNEDLAARRLGEDYRVRIIMDLEKDLQSTRRLSDYYSAVMSSVLETQELLDQNEPAAESLIVAAYRATEVNYNPRFQATWQQVVSSGHIGLLPEAATPLIAEYFAFDYLRQNYDELIESTYRERVRSIIPLKIQQAILRGCSDVRTSTGLVTGFQPNCNLEIEPETARRIAERLKRDERVRSSLNYQYSLVFNAQANTRGLTVLVQRALAELQISARAKTEERDEP